jgi:hypothetical protein
MMASLLGVTNITFEIPGNAFYSGARIGSINFKDLWFMCPPEVAQHEPLSRLLLVSSL